VAALSYILPAIVLLRGSFVLSRLPPSRTRAVSANPRALISIPSVRSVSSVAGLMEERLFGAANEINHDVSTPPAA